MGGSATAPGIRDAVFPRREFGNLSTFVSGRQSAKRSVRRRQSRALRPAHVSRQFGIAAVEFAAWRNRLPLFAFRFLEGISQIGHWQFPPHENNKLRARVMGGGCRLDCVSEVSIP